MLIRSDAATPAAAGKLCRRTAVMAAGEDHGPAAAAAAAVSRMVVVVVVVVGLGDRVATGPAAAAPTLKAAAGAASRVPRRGGPVAVVPHVPDVPGVVVGGRRRRWRGPVTPASQVAPGVPRPTQGRPFPVLVEWFAATPVMMAAAATTTADASAAAAAWMVRWRRVVLTVVAGAAAVVDDGPLGGPARLLDPDLLLAPQPLDLLLLSRDPLPFQTLPFAFQAQQLLLLPLQLFAFPAQLFALPEQPFVFGPAAVLLFLATPVLDQVVSLAVVPHPALLLPPLLVPDLAEG